MLKKKDASRLSELENVIEQGIRAAYETGRALHEIKSERLYKEVGFPAFEAYCKQRWGITPQHAGRMIDYFENVNLTLKTEPTGSVLDKSVINQPLSDKPPLSKVAERALRPIAALRRKDEEAAVEVLKLIQSLYLSGEEVTSEVVKEQIQQKSKLSVHLTSKTSEHYTPQNIIDLVLEFFDADQIDLDPCSNSKDSPNFPAKTVFTKDDDGLTQQWKAKTLFLNPPYGAEIDAWVSKLIHEYLSGNTKEAIALVPARTDTQWFNKLHEFDTCFVRGRLKFVGNQASAPFPSALVYLGNRSDDFCNHFSTIGSIRVKSKSVSKDFSESEEDEETDEGAELEEIILEDGRKLYISRTPNRTPRLNRTNDMVDWAWWTLNPVTGCWHGCKYCLEGSTPILMIDGTTKTIKDIQVGDEIVGIKHYENGFIQVTTKVKDKWETSKPAWKITYAAAGSHAEIICSADHRWMVSPTADPSDEEAVWAAIDPTPFEETAEMKVGYWLISPQNPDQEDYPHGIVKYPITSIEPLNVELPMYDISTGTENFIAGGVVTHNCYARDLANRFLKPKFEPTFYPDRLKAPSYRRVPKEAATHPVALNIFICSMADLFGKWVPEDWIMQVFQMVIDNPQWNFLFLTKFPQRLQEINDKLGGFPDNAWVGTTVDQQHRVPIAEKAFRNIQAKVKWLSCEPLLERLTFNSLEMFDWVVVGGQSASTQTPEFQPPLEWVVHLLNQAIAAKCKVYWKDNLETPKQCPW